MTRAATWAEVHATVAFALVAAESFVAVLSLVTDSPWDWGRFTYLLVLVLLMAGASTATRRVLGRLGVASPLRPQDARREALAEEAANAVRAGQLPAGADAAEWRPRLLALQRKAALLGVLPVVACTFAAGSTVLSSLVHDGAGSQWLWGLAVLTLALPSPLVRIALRGYRRVRRVSTAL